MNTSRTAIQPVGDTIKVLLDAADPHGFSGGEGSRSESGIAVALPASLAWVGYHSFAFDASFGNEDDLKDIYQLYSGFIGKRVFWESLQGAGRRIKDGEDEFVFLKLTDIIAVGDPESKAKHIKDYGKAGSFNV